MYVDLCVMRRNLQNITNLQLCLTTYLELIFDKVVATLRISDLWPTELNKLLIED